MGLRFRRSMTLCKGVRLNFGKNGMSVSHGVKGFRQTYNLNTGKKTTTVGLPGTGIYYTTSEGGKKKTSSSTASKTSRAKAQTSTYDTTYVPVETVRTETVIKEKIIEVPVEVKKKLSYDDIRNLYRVADEKINWFELLSSKTPTDILFNKEAWQYLHSVALKICQGDIDTYLKVIQDINPYDDLLDYATDFDFGTDESDEMHISFKIKDDILENNDGDLKEDYICGCAVRVARDTFALLPIENVFVEVSEGDKEILTVKFDRKSFEKIKFTYSDPSDIVDCYLK